MPAETTTPRYFENWTEHAEMASAFADERYDYSSPAKIPDDMATDDEVLFAWYGYESYSGSAFVLFERDGTLYEVNGGHCSCYGLEGQWAPEETTWDALAARDFKYRVESDDVRAILLDLIAARRATPTGERTA